MELIARTFLNQLFLIILLSVSSLRIEIFNYFQKLQSSRFRTKCKLFRYFNCTDNERPLGLSVAEQRMRQQLHYTFSSLRGTILGA